MLLTPYNSIEPMVLKGVPMTLKIVYLIFRSIDVTKLLWLLAMLPPASVIVSQPSHMG